MATPVTAGDSSTTWSEEHVGPEKPDAGSRPGLRDVPWRWTDLLIGFAPGLALWAVSFFIDPRSSIAAAARKGLLPLLLITQLWMLAFPLWVVRRRRPEVLRLPTARAIGREVPWALLVFLAAMGGMMLIPWAIVRLTGSGTRPPGPWDATSTTFSQAEWVVFGAMGVLLTPIAEELFYRGMFYNTLRKRLHPILAATIQAAVFGMAHQSGLANAAAIATCGLLLAFLYEWRKTLLGPILVHATTNAVGLTFLALAVAAESNAPRMGVMGDASPAGVVLTEVVPGSPAQVAGLRTGDVITSVDGNAVRDITSVAGLVRRHKVGDSASVEFVRDGAARRVEVVLQRLKR